MTDISNDQIIIGIALIIGVIVVGYLLKIAIKFALVAVAVVGMAYIFTTNPDEMTIEHAADWGKKYSESTLNNANTLVEEAKSQAQGIDVNEAQALIKQSEAVLNTIKK